MNRIQVNSTVIISAGYDALHQILEIKFTSDGQICRYYDVPEHIWYGLRAACSINNYFRTRIMGYFQEELINEF